MSQDPLDIVRRMWSALREGGVESALRLVAIDASFVTHDGRIYDGHDGIRAFFASFDARDERFVASPFTFEPVGEGVLVAGHRRIAGPEQAVSEHLHFTHRIDGELIGDLRAFSDRESAVAELHRPRD